ncbi:MAG: hypothetical protein QM756_23110 [Polyangiaceae bacterium]
MICLAAWSPRALAQSAPPSGAVCAEAYEKAQEQRKAGQLVGARESLQSCLNDACPDFIRGDCTAWFSEVQAELPTLVFQARAQGEDLSQVRVSAGERVLSARLDGQAVELDPGEYDLRFEAEGMRPFTQHVVVARGERNRLIEVQLVPLPSTSEPPPAPPKVVPAPPPVAKARSWAAPLVFGGIGVLGVGAFAGLGAWGRSQESSLKNSCSPDCSSQQVGEVRTKYLLADVSLGVGVASLALGAYFLIAGSSSDAAARASARVPQVAVSIGSGSTGVVYGGQF